MNIKETIAEINRAKYQLDAALEENGGELTPELLEQFDTLEDLKALLAGEGIDELGRWLKSVQDEEAALKAEADTAARKLKNHKGYEDYVKGLIGQAMDCLELSTNDKGEKVAKGSFYGFKRTTSNKSSVASELLEEKYQARVDDVAVRAGLPGWLHLQLKTTTSELKQYGGEALEFLQETSTPAITFTKPRVNKEA